MNMGMVVAGSKKRKPKPKGNGKRVNAKYKKK